MIKKYHYCYVATTTVYNVVSWKMLLSNATYNSAFIFQTSIICPTVALPSFNKLASHIDSQHQQISNLEVFIPFPLLYEYSSCDNILKDDHLEAQLLSRCPQGAN